MRVQRTIAMNPVEPEPMSMRVPAKVSLTIDFQYLDVLGRPLIDDVAAQLQVTARSGNTTDVYAVPATDLVNGKARASIPKDTLIDLNGYRLRLVGTYRGEAKLLALGTLRITDAAGIEETPEDIIDNIPINLSYNVDAAITVRIWQDAGKGTPFDLSSATITASIFNNSTDMVGLVDFVVTPTGLPGEVVLSLTAAQVNALPPTDWWALRASSAGGVTTLAQGTVSIIGTPPP